MLIRKGNKYKCIKDFNEGIFNYKYGQTYESNEDNCITDEDGNCLCIWPDWEYNVDDYFDIVLPTIGNYYHFWDDGKTSSSRHYIAKVEEIIPYKKAKEILVSIPVWNYETNQNDFVRVTLYDRWKEQVLNHEWLYTPETDYFIKISVPVYDENYLYAVRTKQGGWFTLDIQSFWQGGDLDVSGKKYERVIEDYYNGQYDWDSIYVEANEENWNPKNIEVK